MERKWGAKIWVTGRVQGVGFRDFVERGALSLDLKGYCKNLSDGRVEVVLEGERKRIDQLVQSLRKGPPLARVSDLKLEWREIGEKFEDFSIRY